MKYPFKNMQELEVIKKYNEFKEEKRKEDFKKIGSFFKSIGQFIFIGVTFLLAFTIAAIVGIYAEPLIYYLNKPLGEGYAHFASYFVSGGMGVILFIISSPFWRKKW